MSLETDIGELKKRAGAIVENAARHDHALSPEEDAAVLRLLEQADTLEHEVAKARRKSPPPDPSNSSRSIGC